jgi:hypothetical protein
MSDIPEVAEALKIGRNYGDPKRIDHGSIPYCTIQEGPDRFKVHDLEYTMNLPARNRGEIRVDDLESFVALVDRFKNAGSTIFTKRHGLGKGYRCYVNFPLNGDDRAWADFAVTLWLPGEMPEVTGEMKWLSVEDFVRLLSNSLLADQIDLDEHRMKRLIRRLGDIPSPCTVSWVESAAFPACIEVTEKAWGIGDLVTTTTDILPKVEDGVLKVRCSLSRVIGVDDAENALDNHVRSLTQLPVYRGNANINS